MSKAVVNSQWESMKKAREIFDNPQAPMEERVEAGLVIERPRFERKEVKKKGVGTGLMAEAISGGPYIRYVEPFMISRKGRATPLTKATFFTWTSKMSAASFSIPAGPFASHGTCPASVEQHVERAGSYEEFHAPLGSRAISRDSKDPTGVYICNKCYAGKNNYLQHKSTSMAQVSRLAWVRKTMRHDADGTQLNPGPSEDRFQLNPQDLQSIRRSAFVAEVSKALRSLRDPAVASVLARKEVDWRFFRIHDAGDFFHPWYYAAWVEVCRLNPEVHFWAPTRVWVYPQWRKVFAEIPPPANLSLRPSALFFGAAPPELDGLAPGTTSYAHGSKIPSDVVQCPVYQSEGANSCASVKCRRCWGQREKVSYAAH